MWLESGVTLLWCRLAAAAPIQPLAWEPPYAAGAALLKKKKEKNCAEALAPSLLNLLAPLTPAQRPDPYLSPEAPLPLPPSPLFPSELVSPLTFLHSKSQLGIFFQDPN